jgi:two-component system chemotaxis response regulator CheB
LPNHDVIVIGASADGLQPLRELLRMLPRDLPAAVFMVLHTGPSGGGMLPDILHRMGGLPVVAARDGEAILPGRVYVPPPDRHLLVHRGHISVVHGPRENGFRPAIDPLFRTAARSYGPRVVGVVLSGMLDDGAWGLHEVIRLGGIGLAQDPFEATFPAMPRAALRLNPAARALPLAAIAHEIGELASTSAEDVTLEDREDPVESPDALETGERRGQLTRLTCPDCNGTLEEIEEGGVAAARYRCHLGHGHTARSLMHGQEDKVEAALWEAMRALEESAHLRRRMADRATSANQLGLALAYQEQVETLLARAHTIREVLEHPVRGEDAEHGAEGDEGNQGVVD